jgi:hypothetical protein
MAFIEYPYVQFSHPAERVLAERIQKAYWASTRHRRRTRG